jgi:hypothetical protein
MDAFYKVYGPRPDDPKAKWHVKAVDCWWCLKPRSVTKKNRCYVPVRVQDHIDGSFMTSDEVEDKMTRSFGYFHTWQCALAYCKVHYPNICHKVHRHAHKNGFSGVLAPATDPRFVQMRFHPYIAKQESAPHADLVPSRITGIYMRQVPLNEQNSLKFPDAQVVLEQVCDDVELPTEFPQQVVDSEQLMEQLEGMAHRHGKARQEDETGTSEGEWATDEPKKKAVPVLKKAAKKKAVPVLKKAAKKKAAKKKAAKNTDHTEHTEDVISIMHHKRKHVATLVKLTEVTELALNTAGSRTETGIIPVPKKRTATTKRQLQVDSFF